MSIESTIPTTLPLRSGTWALDTAHSSVSFSIRHLGVAKVRGRFGDVAVDLHVGDDLASTTLAATIQVASVDTGNADRDAHILAPDMVDVALRPTLAYRSKAIRPDGEGWLVDGELTIGEVTAPVALRVELGGIEQGPDGRRHAGFEATAQVRRQDFGLMPSIPSALLGEVIRVDIDAEVLEP